MNAHLRSAHRRHRIARDTPTAQDLFGLAGTPRVVVVGAGLGGIGAGVKLRQAGIHTFTIYESPPGVGGTWWDNTYPGAEVDVHSSLYRYSFKSYDWSRTHARQPELQSYLEETVDQFGLRSHYLARIQVTGRRGETLQEHWAGEPRAHLGITVPGFPNFFMLYGPGTNCGELVFMLEAQAEYAVRAVKRMRRRPVSSVEVKPAFEALWFVWLQSRMEGTSWTMTNNYFRSSTGKVVTQWPSGNLVYRLLTKVLGGVSEATRCREAGAS